MNTKWLTNPFFVYILSFLLVFIVYSLGWSDVYPPISYTVKLFLLATFVISFFLGFFLEKRKMNAFKPIQSSNYNLLVIGIIFVGYVLEFIYSGGVPLLQTLRGGYSYKEFTGIPTLHVILSTFHIFYSVYLFHQYVSRTSSRRQLLLLFLVSLMFNLLVLNRGAIMITFASCLFIYLLKLKTLKLRKLIPIPIGVLLIIYLFGIVGNIRYSVSQEDKNYILKIGGAADSFIESDIPKEYYWGYLYIASPIGNFQNIVTYREEEFKVRNLVYFALTEPFPDFIAKRMISLMGEEEPVEDPAKYLVIPVLNAPTVYYRSFLLIGWCGAWLMYLHSAIVMLVYPFLIRKDSQYYITSWACLLTLILFNIFSNMWQVIGTVLIWPLLFSFFERIKLRTNETKS